MGNVFDPIVAVNALGYSIGSTEIISNLSFSQSSGQHLLLLGPSGVGKTSLINLITGFATPSRGSIMVGGETISALPGAKRDALRRKTIGVVFQTLRLISALSVRENLKLAQKLALDGTDMADVDALIEAVGIGHRRHARPRQLSQGEAQRAAIARALVSRPKLIIADEPTSALDHSNADNIAQLLLQKAEEFGATLLIATHDVRLKSHIPNAIMLEKLN
jgi:putative ABC transport system ATP-binding protein